jgi:hypothetical protein
LHNTWSWKGIMHFCFLFFASVSWPQRFNYLFILAGQALNQIFMICTWSSLTNLTQDPWVRRCWKLHMRTARLWLLQLVYFFFSVLMVKKVRES